MTLGQPVERQPEAPERREKRTLDERRLRARDPHGHRLRLVLDGIDRPRELRDRLGEARHHSAGQVPVVPHVRIGLEPAHERLERAREPHGGPGAQSGLEASGREERLDLHRVGRDLRGQRALLASSLGTDRRQHLPPEPSQPLRMVVEGRRGMVAEEGVRPWSRAGRRARAPPGGPGSCRRRRDRSGSLRRP